MKRLLLPMALLHFFCTTHAQFDNPDLYPAYTGTDLGVVYHPDRTQFKIWSPVAEAAELRLYHSGTGNYPAGNYPMVKKQNGCWEATIYTDQQGKFYTFRVKINGVWSAEVTDPYVKAVSVNGRRGAIIDFSATDPAGWDSDKSPQLKHPTEAIIYELHVRDASIHESSGIKRKGKFQGLTETGTTNPEGLSTGLDHIKKLGVTHVHLLPVFDYNSVDETKPDTRYNWGYDPLNYNVPEGSYALNPYEPAARIREFKQLVKTFHEQGIGVIMDVVYNHTALTETSSFNQLVPGYYYRQTADGKFSNATACGNETASERPMFRKFMLESLMYWVKEYHVDGFRVDLMGVHDIETMNLISGELHKLKPGILIYGEGWTAGASPVPDSLRALKTNGSKLDRIAVFSDDIRDGIKGSVFDHADKGFVSGKPGMEQSIRFGITASCPHPQVDYTAVNYSKKPWSENPGQTINYCSCHDNHTLWDKLSISATGATETERINMHKLALSVVLTSQGIPFLHAGTEMLRSKKGVENSYESPDSINAIDWNLLSLHRDVYAYVHFLVQLRKTHPAFRLQTGEQISTLIRFTEQLPGGGIAYTIDGFKAGDSWKKILVCLNNSNQDIQWTSAENWKPCIVSNSNYTGTPEAGNKLALNAYSCGIYYQD